MGRCDWSYANKGHWEAPEDTTVSAGAPSWFHAEGVTTRPSKSHPALEKPIEPEDGAERGLGPVVALYYRSSTSYQIF
jgi:hypothetical protein